MKFLNNSIEGYKGMKIPYTLSGKSEGSDDLTILLPGAGYTVNSPVFHYSKGIAFKQSSDILEVNYRYNDDVYNDFSADELREAVKMDSRLVIDAILETHSYRNFYFIGKSLGTIAMSSELNRDVFKDAKTIWLTPLLNLDEVFTSMVNSRNKGLCIIGDQDHHYSEESFSKLTQNEHITSKLIPGAIHSLDDPEDVIESIDILKKIITDIDEFLTTE